MGQKILVAVDIGEMDMARAAIAAAEALAATSGDEHRLVHVRSPVPVSRMDFVPPEYFLEQEKLAADALARLAGAVGLDPARVSTASRFGPAYVGVLDEARDWNADLIVVSAHQPTMATYLLGSNAKKIVLHAHCSVLVVRTEKKASLFE